jgi:hypothetical protein
VPVKSYGGGAEETVDLFLRNTIEVLVFAMETPATPTCRIKFPANLMLAEFKTFVASALDVPYDPTTASMSIYKKDQTEDKPATTPIRDYLNYGLILEFSANVATEYRIWVQINNEISEQLAATRQLVIVEYQESIGALPRSERVLSAKNSSLNDFLTLLVELRIVPDTSVKVYRLYNHKINRCLSQTDLIYSTETSLFVTTPAALSVAPEEFVLYGNHVIHDHCLRGILSPFLVKVSGNEKIPDFFVRLRAFLGREEAEFKKLRFMLGTEHSHYSANAILKGDQTMGEAIHEVSKPGNVYLFVIHPASQKTVGITRDLSLRIYN